MALTIETGANISGADSYVTRAAVIAHAAARGITIADADATDESYIRPAFDYINALEEKLMGCRANENQAGAFPRTGLFLRGYERRSDDIPEVVEELQISLAVELFQGTDIWNRPLSASNPVKKNRVEGVVTQEFAVQNGTTMLSQHRSMALISELMGPSSGVASIALSRG